MFPIQSNLPQPLSPGLPLSAKPSQQNPIGSAFAGLLNETMAAEATAHQAVETALLGGDITQAEVMASVKKADLSVRMLIQIRNKVVEALNEVQQMKF